MFAGVLLYWLYYLYVKACCIAVQCKL